MNAKSWDKIILVLVALIVIGVSALLSVRAMGFGEKFALEPGIPNNELPETLEVRATMAKSFVEKTQSWATVVRGEGGNAKPVPLFVSIPIVEANGVLIVMTDPDAPLLRPPVSNDWLRSNNLDFLNSGVLAQDPDGDGFTSLAEWEAKTLPNDAKSHPPYAGKLIFVSRQQQDYTLKFSAQPGEERYQILRVPTAKWPERKNFYLRIGEVSEDKQFRLESFEERRAKNNTGIEVDASALKITYLPTQEIHELVKNIETPIPTFFAEMKFELDPQFKEYIKEGDAFTVSADPGTKYRVVKVNEASVTISYQTGTETEQTLEIIKK